MIFRKLAPAAFAIVTAISWQNRALAEDRAAGTQPVTPISDDQELKMKIQRPFTVAIGGDLNYRYPIANSADPAVQAVLNIFRKADAAVANFEGSMTSFDNPVGQLNSLDRDKEIANDVHQMGFSIVARANNHSLDGGAEQMLDATMLLNEAGVKSAGVGRDLQEARSAQYISLPAGRLGMVSLTTNSPYSRFGSGKATIRYGIYGGTPGQNVVDLTRYQVVTSEQLRQLRSMRDTIYTHRAEISTPVPPIASDEPSDRLQFMTDGPYFKAGDKPGGLSWEMNREDLRDILRNVRNGKETSDFLVTTIHTHEDDNALWLQFWGETPTDFEIELAHKAIDAGSDVFFGTGTHVLRGIEIYKNRPIFYGMHALIYTLGLSIPSVESYTIRGLNPYATNETDLEQVWDYFDQQGRPRLSAKNMDGMVAEAKYDKGVLKEIVIHPIVLGADLPKSQMGMPRVPSAQDARRILEHIKTLSAPFGTKVIIENELGIIKVSDPQ